LERYRDLNGTSQKAEAVQPEMGQTPAGTAAPDASIHQDAEPEKDPEVDQGPPAQYGGTWTRENFKNNWKLIKNRPKEK